MWFLLLCLICVMVVYGIFFIVGFVSFIAEANGYDEQILWMNKTSVRRWWFIWMVPVFPFWLTKEIFLEVAPKRETVIRVLKVLANPKAIVRWIHGHYGE